MNEYLYEIWGTAHGQRESSELHICHFTMVGWEACSYKNVNLPGVKNSGLEFWVDATEKKSFLRQAGVRSPNRATRFFKQYVLRIEASVLVQRIRRIPKKAIRRLDYHVWSSGPARTVTQPVANHKQTITPLNPLKEFPTTCSVVDHVGAHR